MRSMSMWSLDFTFSHTASLPSQSPVLFIPRVSFIFVDLFTFYFPSDFVSWITAIGILMYYMEEECRSEAPSPPPQSAGNVDCNRGLTRSPSDASSVVDEKCEGIFHFPENMMPNDHTGWTDEKHNLYLNHLEVSFTEKLHQSKRLLAGCSEKYKGDQNASQKWLIDLRVSPEKLTVSRTGCQQNIGTDMGETRSIRAVAYPHTLRSAWMSNCKHMTVHYPPMAELQEYLKHCCRTKHGKRILSLGFTTRTKQVHSSFKYEGELFEVIKEGTDQNFVDDDDESTSNSESSSKRLKAALADVSNQDHNSPSCRSPKAGNSSISHSNREEMLHPKSKFLKV